MNQNVATRLQKFPMSFLALQKKVLDPEFVQIVAIAFYLSCHTILLPSSTFLTVAFCSRKNLPCTCYTYHVDERFQDSRKSINSTRIEKMFTVTF